MTRGRHVSPQLLTPGVLFQLVRAGEADSRAELARTTGLARSTVSQRVDALLGLGLLVEQGGGTRTRVPPRGVPRRGRGRRGARGGGASTGGRPPTRLAFDTASGVVLCADLGATHCRLAVSDLDCTLLVERPADMDIARGPDVVLAWVQERFTENSVHSG